MSRDRKWLWIISGLALIFRVGHFVMLHTDPVSSIPVLDSWSYDRLARLIAFGDGLPSEVYFQAPFYPYFLAVLYRLSSGSLDIVRIIQLLMDTVSVILMFRVTRYLFNLRAAIFAGLTMAVYPVLIFHTGLILKTSLNVFFACLMLWLIFEPHMKCKLLRMFLLGVITGLAAATQGSVLLQIPLIIIWIFVWSDWKRPALFTKHLVMFMLGLLISIGPFTLRNYSVSGRFVLLTAQGGANFYLGNSPYSDGTSKRPPRVRMTPEHEEA
ncbi:glycosyltransferase family 39 protein, partial [bacterium]|nr:glycosyltransferase family 39 protein [bacterium]